MTIKQLATDLLIAPAAGYAATKVMERISMTLYQLEPEQDRAREDEARPGPPFLIAADKTLPRLGIRLHGATRQRAGMAFHYGVAIGWAPVYAWLRRTAHLRPITAGLVAGATNSLIIDETLTPALGFSAPNSAYPLITHVRGFAAHLAFGLALGAVTEAAWAVSGSRPQPRVPPRH